MILQRLLASADRFPDKVAVEDDRMSLTYGQLVRAAAYLSKMLAERTKTQTVGFLLPACAGFAPFFYACRWAGRVPVPLNFLLPPADLAAVVADAGPDTILTLRFFQAQAEALGRQVIYIDDELARLKDLAAKLALVPKALWPKPPAVPTYQPDDLAVLLYTSGTSGQPKGVMLTEGNLASNVDACIAAARMSADNTFLAVLPLFHSFGLLALLIAPLTVGGSGYYHPRFSAPGAVKTIAERKIAVFMAVPSMYAAMMRLKDAPADALRSLYLAMSGGEPLPAAVRDGMRARFGLELQEGYGLTETSPVVSLNPPHANRPGTVGQVLGGWEVRIVTEDGRDLPRGEIGEIWLRGPSLSPGYFNNARATAESRTPDGWFRTGDIGKLDAEHYLSICGRKKEMIIIAGENVFPAEIETALLRHPAVAQAAVIGVPDPLRGEQPLAFVVLKEGALATEPELREHARAHLAVYKVPRSIRVLPSLPTGPTGKVLKRALTPDMGLA